MTACRLLYLSHPPQKSPIISGSFTDTKDPVPPGAIRIQLRFKFVVSKWWQLVVFCICRILPLALRFVVKFPLQMPLDTGWRRPIGCLKLVSLSAKEPLIMGLFCGHWLLKIRHPMGLRHPVLLIVNPMGRIKVHWTGFTNILKIRCHSICNRVYHKFHECTIICVRQNVF